MTVGDGSHVDVVTECCVVVDGPHTGGKHVSDISVVTEQAKVSTLSSSSSPSPSPSSSSSTTSSSSSSSSHVSPSLLLKEDVDRGTSTPTNSELSSSPSSVPSSVPSVLSSTSSSRSPSTTTTTTTKIHQHTHRVNVDQKINIISVTVTDTDTEKERAKDRRLPNAKKTDGGLGPWKARLVNFLMGIFVGKHGLFCCWCWSPPPEDHVPFWTRDDTEHEDYSNASFESTEQSSITRTHASRRSNGAPRQTRLSKLAKEKGLDLQAAPPSPPKAITSPNNNNNKKSSESESEDSFSMTYSETASDASDVENRVQRLNDELKRRKMEAEKLKREQKKRQKDKLKVQEDYLKKQIEAYDNYISQVKVELQGETDTDTPRSPVRPQIKSPPFAEHTRLKQQKEQASSVDRRVLPAPGGTTPAATTTTATVAGDSSKIINGEVSSLVTQRSKTSALDQRTGSRDVSEVTEDVQEEVVSESATSDQPQLKLKLDTEMQEVERLPAITPRDSARTPRSISEIPEEYTVPTSARSDTSEQESVALKLGQKVPASEGTKSARSDVTYTDRSEEFETSSEKSDKSISRSSAKSDQSSVPSSRSTSSSSRSEANSVVSAARSEPSVSREPVVTAQEPSVHESLHTEEDISEEILSGDEEGSESEVALDLKIAQPPASAGVTTAAAEEESLRGFSVGDRVLVGDVQPGTLLYKGHTDFATGYWSGVELDKAEGRNDGTIHGVFYFKCKPGHGIFAPPEKLSHFPADYRPEDHHKEAEVGDLSDLSLGSEDTMDKVIKSASSAVEEIFGAEPRAASTSETLSSMASSPRKDADSPASTPRREEGAMSTKEAGQEQTEVERQSSDKCDQAAEVATKNLLTEAIAQMIDIRKKKESHTPPKASAAPPSGESSTPPQAAAVAGAAAGPSSGESSKKFAALPRGSSERSGGSSLLAALGIDRNDIVLDPDLDPDLLRPSSPLERKEPLKQDDLDMLYDELGALTGADEWMDDDFGMSFAHKPPPPYPEKQPNEPGLPLGRQDLKLDLQKLTDEVLYAVPHKREEVVKLVEDTVDLFWEARRYGESWDGLQPPATYFSAGDRGADMESRSRHVYKGMIFDLTAEILREMYQDEDESEAEQPPWAKPAAAATSRRRPRYNRKGSPPTTLHDLLPVVRDHVLSHLQLDSAQAAGAKARQYNSRKKKDNVDHILVAELREEEPQWVNYDSDELAVKMQLVDTLFESLLGDTARAIGSASSRKQQARTSC